MKNRKHTTKAVEILHRRYIGDSAERKESLETERLNAQAARIIYDLRQEAGMTQKELAKLIGTTQSVISRLEDADYEGHSLSMLNRIAQGLNRGLTIQLAAAIEDDQPSLPPTPRRKRTDALGEDEQRVSEKDVI